MKTILRNVLGALALVVASVATASADFTVMADSATSSVQGAINAVGPAIIGIAGFCCAIGVIILLTRKAAK